MGLRAQLAALASRFKHEVAYYRALQKHPQTPRLAKALLWLALGYLVLPFDLIPDFIPVIGQLDELVIVPLLLYLALKVTPVSVRQECRDKLESADNQK
jgi:uncharacterized membrane protein YkvA (DUF1232 family)